MSSSIGMAAAQELGDDIRGELFRAGDPRYEGARHVWNGMIDKMPAAIVRPSGVSDVIATVRYAAERNLPLALRGGGHNIAGNATCDGGLVLDFQSMKSVRVDPDGRTVRAEPGVLWRELDHEVQAFGMATTGGVVSTTGIAGLTLGGGYGYLARRHGLACDNLISADVVTAAGELITASAENNPDLLWGLRGGGGNFGVVTSFKYRLHPVSGVLGGLILYPFESAKEVLNRFREIMAEAGEELTVLAGLLPLPTGGKAAGVVVSYFGNEEDGRRALKPIRGLGSVMLDTVAWVPYCQLQRQLEASYSKGFRNYWKSSFVKGLDDDLIDLVIEKVGSSGSDNHVVIEPWGGAIARVGKEETAFDQREAPFNLMILAVSTDPAIDAEQIAWAREFWQAVQPHSTGGAYVNYLGVDETAQAAYSGGKYERLAELKAKFDPTNLFRLNQNIRPAS